MIFICSEYAFAVKHCYNLCLVCLQLRILPLHIHTFRIRPMWQVLVEPSITESIPLSRNIEYLIFINVNQLFLLVSVRHIEGKLIRPLHHSVGADCLLVRK